MTTFEKVIADWAAPFKMTTTFEKAIAEMAAPFRMTA
jgi:hypothetical protein